MCCHKLCWFDTKVQFVSGRNKSITGNSISFRNKCEFTIGYHPETNEVTVGFRLASYKKGSVGVVEADHLPIVSDLMKSVVKYFQVSLCYSIVSKFIDT